MSAGGHPGVSANPSTFPGLVAAGGGDGGGVLPPAALAIIMGLPGDFAVINARLASLERNVAKVHNATCGDGLSYPYMIVPNADGVDPTAPAPTGPGLPPLHNRGSIGALSQADRDAYKLFYGIPDKDPIDEEEGEGEEAGEEEAPDPAILQKYSIAKAIGARVRFD